MELALRAPFGCSHHCTPPRQLLLQLRQYAHLATLNVPQSQDQLDAAHKLMQSAVVMDSIVVQVATHVTCPPEPVSKKVETVDTSFQAKSQLSELA